MYATDYRVESCQHPRLKQALQFPRYSTPIVPVAAQSAPEMKTPASNALPKVSLSVRATHFFGQLGLGVIKSSLWMLFTCVSCLRHVRAG
jgi:hypothetical protein